MKLIQDHQECIYKTSVEKEMDVMAMVAKSIDMFEQ